MIWSSEGWLSRPFRLVSASRFDVFVFCRFGTARVMFCLPLSVSPSQPAPRFENRVFRSGGRAMVSYPNVQIEGPKSHIQVDRIM